MWKFHICVQHVLNICTPYSLPFKYPISSNISSQIVLIIVTHWILLILLLCILVLGHLLGTGNLTLVTKPKKCDSSSLSTHPFLIVPQLRLSLPESLPTPDWNFILSWSYTDLLWVSMDSISCGVQLSCLVQKKAFHCTSPILPLLTYCFPLS